MHSYYTYVYVHISIAIHDVACTYVRMYTYRLNTVMETYHINVARLCRYQ